MAAKWTVENTVLTQFEFYFSQRNDFGVYYLFYDVLRKPLGTCSKIIEACLYLDTSKMAAKIAKIIAMKADTNLCFAKLQI
jgi:hypothetical protein